MDVVILLTRYHLEEATISDINVKIGVLSDTHLHQVTRGFKDFYNQHLSHMDFLFHAGDFVSLETVNLLSEKEFHGVQGNMDPHDVMRLLPRKKIIEIGPYRLGLIHGWGSPSGLEERIGPEFSDVDVIVYGHSHRAVSHMKGGILFFNPGTASGHTSSGVHSYGVLELGDRIRGRIIPVK